MDESSAARATARMRRAVAALKAQALGPLLQKAIVAISADRHQQGADLALDALRLDDQCALAWHVLALCREKAADFPNAIRCYEAALKLAPQDLDVANDLGRLAYRMGMVEVAQRLFAHCLAHRPGAPDIANNLACTLRDQMRFGEAIETVRAALAGHPAHTLLWNTLGTVMTEQGEMDKAVTFYQEALRLDPAFAKARYNLANARLALGDPRGALEDCDKALSQAAPGEEVAVMTLARAFMLIADRDLAQGWATYEARFDAHLPDATQFLIDRPRWTPGAALAGRSLLLVGEQGLGDEVMFANLVPDVLDALGPDGRLTLAVEPRLTTLFQRSFPQARVGPHVTGAIGRRTGRAVRFIDDPAEVDLWAPLASVLQDFRPGATAFPDRPAHLTPDLGRTLAWRDVLAAGGAAPTVGIVWKSLKMDASRSRHFSPFEQWRPVLQTPGVRFVNLQYGECAAELAAAREQLGVDIWTLPGIDLKQDLDELSALTCALDLVIGPMTATTNIAAASGARVWFVTPPGAWTKCGTDRLPWYPRARVFTAPAYNDWGPAMDEAAAALSRLCSRPGSAGFRL